MCAIVPCVNYVVWIRLLLIGYGCTTLYIVNQNSFLAYKGKPMECNQILFQLFSQTTGKIFCSVLFSALTWQLFWISISIRHGESHTAILFPRYLKDIFITWERNPFFFPLWFRGDFTSAVSSCLEAFMPCTTPGRNHLDKSITTVTIESVKQISRAAFEDFVESLLWEKSVLNADSQPMLIMRLKVSMFWSFLSSDYPFCPCILAAGYAKSIHDSLKEDLVFI